MLYELLTGRPPFLASSAMDTIMQVTRDEAMAPTRIVADTPRDIETICMKCLQKEPDKRYQSALALAEDLERFQLGEPIQARPVGGVERLWRWCRRNPRIALLTGAVAVLLISVTAVSTTSAIRISQAQKETERQKEVAIEEKERADEARMVADANAKVANEMSTLSMSTLLNLVTKVQAQLQNRPGMGKLKDGILDDAIKGLDQVAKTARNSSMAARIRGGVFQRKGDMFVTAGKTEEAQQQYVQSLELFKKGMDELAPDDPEREIAQYNVAVLDAKLGDVSLHRGMVPDAKKHHEEALRLRKALAEAKLRHPKLQDPAVALGAVASSYTSLGTLAMQEGNIAGARDCFHEAYQIRQKLLRGPNDFEGLHAQASSLNGLAEMSYRLDDKEATWKYYTDLLQLMRDLLASDPDNVGYKKDLASTYERMGDINLFWRRPLEKTLGYYRRGEELRQRSSRASLIARSCKRVWRPQNTSWAQSICCSGSKRSRGRISKSL